MIEFVNIDTDKDLHPEASIGRAPDPKIENDPQPKIGEIPGSRKFPDLNERNARSGKTGSVNHGTPLAHNQVGFKILTKKLNVTGKSFSEAFILTSTNPQYDKRSFIDLPVQYMKFTSSQNMLCT